MPNQKAIERHAVFEKPEESGTVHQGEPRITQCHQVVAPRLVLQHGALAEPGAGRHPGETDCLSVARHRPQPNQAGDHSRPVFKAIAAHANDLICIKGSLGNASAGTIDLLLIELTRPRGDSPQVIRGNHDPDDIHPLR